MDPSTTLQSVQVLKGPQGTCSVRNTTGGALLVTPNRPEDGFGGELTAGFGNYAALRYGRHVNLPAWREFAVARCRPVATTRWLHE